MGLGGEGLANQLKPDIYTSHDATHTHTHMHMHTSMGMHTISNNDLGPHAWDIWTCTT